MQTLPYLGPKKEENSDRSGREKWKTDRKGEKNRKNEEREERKKEGKEGKKGKYYMLSLKIQSAY